MTCSDQYECQGDPPMRVDTAGRSPLRATLCLLAGDQIGRPYIALTVSQRHLLNSNSSIASSKAARGSASASMTGSITRRLTISPKSPQ